MAQLVPELVERCLLERKTKDIRTLRVEAWNLHRRAHLADYSGWPEALAKARLPKLSALIFERGNIDLIDASSGLEGLTHLELDCTADVADELHLSSVETLWLPQLTERGLLCVAGAGLHAPRLKHLTIAAANKESYKAVIPADAVVELFRADRFPNLRHLSISNIRPGTAFFSKLATTPLLAHLDELCLLGDFDDEEATLDLIKSGDSFMHLRAWELDREIDRDRLERPNMRPISGRPGPTSWPMRCAEVPPASDPVPVQALSPKALPAAAPPTPAEPVQPSLDQSAVQNERFRQKLAPIAAALDVKFSDPFLDYVRLEWRLLPEWFRTPDEWEDLAAVCTKQFGSYRGLGGLVIGHGMGGDLRVARFFAGGRLVSGVIEWIPHEAIRSSEAARAESPVTPGFRLGDRVLHPKLGAGRVIERRARTLSLVRWDDGSESVRLNKFLQHVSVEDGDGEHI